MMRIDVERPEPTLVLIIDDDADWVTECGFMVEQLGYEVMGALSCEAAFDAVRDHPVSVAIIDYNLPCCNGITLAEHLLETASAQGRQLRFIMATAFATMDVAVAAMRATVSDFLQKPVAPAELREALQRTSGIAQATPARTALLNKLSSLSSELRQLSSLIGGTSPPATGGRTTPVAALSELYDHDKLLTDYIRRELQIEARRRQLGSGTLFGDPAWYMLLDLLLAKLEDRMISVSSASIASGVPTTTALRLIKRLVGDNVLSRVPDEHDGRRDFLFLNAEVEQLLMEYLTEQARQAG